MSEQSSSSNLQVGNFDYIYNECKDNFTNLIEKDLDLLISNNTLTSKEINGETFYILSKYKDILDTFKPDNSSTNYKVNCNIKDES